MEQDLVENLEPALLGLQDLQQKHFHQIGIFLQDVLPDLKITKILLEDLELKNKQQIYLIKKKLIN